MILPKPAIDDLTCLVNAMTALTRSITAARERGFDATFRATSRTNGDQVLGDMIDVMTAIDRARVHIQGDPGRDDDGETIVMLKPRSHFGAGDMVGLDKDGVPTNDISALGRRLIDGREREHRRLLDAVDATLAGIPAEAHPPLDHEPVPDLETLLKRSQDRMRSRLPNGYERLPWWRDELIQLVGGMGGGIALLIVMWMLFT